MSEELQPGKGPGQWYRTVVDELGPQPRWGGTWSGGRGVICKACIRAHTVPQ